MARIVMKFGGTSVGSIDRIKAVADQVKLVVDEGHEVAVVVSAMSGTTNQLVKWTQEIGKLHDAREYDVVVSSGEQVTTGLLAIALQSIGIEARSWLGWQVAVETDNIHGGATIERITAEKMSDRLRQGQVAVMAGFQGVTEENRITTLGRGGSDTSAVALAAALNADRCDIYTDVDGIYTADPRIVPRARKLDTISFEEILELASLGAKVLQTRSVAMAMRHGVELRVLSSFESGVGTRVIREEDVMEKNPVSGITATSDEAKISIVGIEDKPGIAAMIFGHLASNHINVDMIVQTASRTDKTDITFSVAETNLERAQEVIENLRSEMEYAHIISSKNISKISVVGMAMRSQAGIAKTMFETLSEKGINIDVISTSEIKISVLISSEYSELAVRSLHSAFGLDCE